MAKSKTMSRKPAGRSGSSNGKAAAPAGKPRKISPSSKPRTKGELYNTIADQTGLSRKQVAGVFDAMGQVCAADLGKGAGVVNLGGLMKVMCIRKPATKEATKPNPFKPGEMMTVKAKPARNVIKVRPLKTLKGMV
ncbi:MAG TPA: HU family DNA-binding protein [Phycisphaerales bacterium]|nr:HU family DNA-binding protein [Phycisphaerales bacterium]